MDQASMHGEIAVYLTDPIARQHVVIEQSTTLYFDTHAEGKLVEHRGSRPCSRQNADDSKMKQFIVDVNTDTSNIICKADTELAQDGADESENSMTSTSISDTKPNDTDIRDKSEDSPALCTFPDNATLKDRNLMEKVNTSITIDILTTEGIADDAEFQQSIHETDTEICKQCTEPAQGANDFENTVIENHTDNSECLRFLEDIETAHRSNTICEECTKNGQGEGKVENSMAESPMVDSKSPQFVENCKSPRTICKERVELEQGADEIENPMAESRLHNLERPQCLEESNNKSTKTICKECTQHVQDVDEVRNEMTEMSPRFVRKANTKSPYRICKECIELAQGANVIENQTVALASDTQAEPGDVREKRSEMPEPTDTPRVDTSNNEQLAENMSIESPQFVVKTRIESPAKTCDECIELAQGADLIENPTNALASDTQAESGKFREKRSETAAYIPPDSGRVDNSDNEQFAEKMSIDSPHLVEETRIESPNNTCEECIELAQGADVTANPTEALVSDTQAESDGIREKISKTPDSPAYTPPDSGCVDNSDDEQCGEKLRIDNPDEFVEETRIRIPNKTREECRELAQGAKHATENRAEFAFASDYTQAEFEKRSETPRDSPASYAPPDSGRVDMISENEQNPEEMMTIDIPKFTISDATKLAAEGGHMNTNESLINMCIILNPSRDGQPGKSNELTDAADLREESGGDSDDMSSGCLEILEKIEDLNTKYTEARQKTENLELNLSDLTEKIRLLQCKIEKQEQQINDAQSKQVEQERILLSPMRNIYLRQFHDHIREAIAKKLSKTALYADHHKELRLRVQTNKEVSHRYGIEHFFDADLWSLMHEAQTRAPKVFSKAALWNHFVSDVLQDSALLEGELGLSAAAVRITKFGRSPDAKDNSVIAQLRNKVVYAELITRQDEERRPAYSECYEFLFNVPPESMNNKPSFPPDDNQVDEQSDAPNMQSMANVVEKLKQPLVDSGTSGEASESFSSTTSITSEDSE